MEVFKLLPNTHYPGDSITKFDSLIWTERYLEAGDFQLTATNDMSIVFQLPLGTLISHTNTREVMIVETLNVKRETDKKLTVSISGRSFETFAECRPARGSEKSEVDSVTGVENTTALIVGSGAAVAASLLKTGLQFDVAGFPTGAPTLQIIPNLEVALSLNSPNGSQTHLIKRGSLYSVVYELLKLDFAGIQNQRPLGLDNKLIVKVHDGADLTSEVIFSAAQDDLTAAEYFQTIKNHRTHAQVSTWKYSREIRHRDDIISSPPEPVGLDRRILYVEAFDLKGLPAAYTPPSDSDSVSARGQLELDSNRSLLMTNINVSKTATPKFKINYDVGDLVTVVGEFGPARVHRVTEHILTLDENGQKGYPALKALDI